jgi:superfamily II DNA or RNA helicase
MTHPTTAFLARSALHARALHAPDAQITIGSITLLPHQAAAVHWLQHRITRYGGALLADPPGLGKTYVALAIAAERGMRPLIIAPAALRPRWREAARTTEVPIDFISTERLSAPAIPTLEPHPFIIIDEAHHLRTASTRRHQRTAELCAYASVLLLTATPIHNHASDLAQITALFHLPAEEESTSTLRRLTLRRTLTQILGAGMTDHQAFAVPTVEYRRSIRQPSRAGNISDAIMRLPPISDTDAEGHPLLQLGLLHALRSSDAACKARLRHRIAGTLAIEQATRSGVVPTAIVRRAWRAQGSDIQLAMPQLLATSTTPPDHAAGDRARSQRLALQALLPSLDGHGDAQRAVTLRRFARWCRHPVVAFTQFTATAAALYHLLRHQPGIAMLCGAQARIASGTVSRAEVIDRLLSPDRQRHNAVRLLITTDVLSEGLSLAGVATIVHLDLPWTAARIDQRVGRAARIGAPVRTVRVVELPGSAPSAAVHQLRTVLHRKRGAMEQFEAYAGGTADHVTLLRRLAGSSRNSTAGSPAQRNAVPRWVTVRSAHVGCQVVVALVRVHGRRMLVAFDGDWLRAPTTADWRAASHSVEIDADCRSARIQLVRALEEHVDEQELRRVVSRGGHHRMEERRQADEELRAADRMQRLAGALRFSLARRGIMQATRAAHLKRRGLAPPYFGTAFTQDLVDHAAIEEPDTRIRLRAGVVIIPS